MAQQFAAMIYNFGPDPCVDVPENISRAFGRSGYINVKGTIKGLMFRSTLVPRGSGKYRLYLRPDILQWAGGLRAGDKVAITLEIDLQEKTLPMPSALSREFTKNQAAKEAFDKLTISQRQEILDYLTLIKHPETLQHNIDQLIKKLLGKTDT